MQSSRPHKPRLAAWLLASLLLLAQWGTLAHQIEHQAQGPHIPCPVCVCADQFGNAVPAAITTAVAVSPDTAYDAATADSPSRSIALAFRSRAPPLLPLAT